jgi:hypothetical protein
MYGWRNGSPKNPNAELMHRNQNEVKINSRRKKIPAVFTQERNRSGHQTVTVLCLTFCDWKHLFFGVF